MSIYWVSRYLCLWVLCVSLNLISFRLKSQFLKTEVLVLEGRRASLKNTRFFSSRWLQIFRHLFVPAWWKLYSLIFFCFIIYNFYTCCLSLCFIYFYTCNDESVTFNSAIVLILWVFCRFCCHQVIEIGHVEINFYLFVEEKQILLCFSFT